LDISEEVIERLMSFLLKNGSPEKVLSELRSLTKSDAPFARLAKEGISQLKLITSNSSILEMKVNLKKFKVFNIKKIDFL